MTRRCGFWSMALACGIGVYGAIAGASDPSTASTVHAVAEPAVLDTSIQGQWGAHTFGYLLEGTSALYWSARRYTEGSPPGLGPMLVGQYPKRGSDLPVAVVTLAIEGEDVFNHNTPQLVRTPDGHLHVFLTSDHRTKNPNYNRSLLHYYRTERPDDIRSLVDRTALIRFDGRSPYTEFHARLNVGVSPDGDRMALVILAISNDGSVGFNTPVLFTARRDGLDFRFDPPVAYAEPMGFFYPQLVAGNEGIVVVGQVERDPGRYHARLMHLGWDGALHCREELPNPTGSANVAEDVRPTDDSFREMVILTHDWGRGFDLWHYDTRARRLALLRSVAFDEGRQPGHLKCLLDGRGGALVIGAPRHATYAYRGSLHGSEPFVSEALAQPATASSLGFQTNYYICIPNRIYGSLEQPGIFWLAGDFANPSWKASAAGPFTWLLWRMAYRMP